MSGPRKICQYHVFQVQDNCWDFFSSIQSLNYHSVAGGIKTEISLPNVLNDALQCNMELLGMVMSNTDTILCMDNLQDISNFPLLQQTEGNTAQARCMYGAYKEK